LRILRKHTFPTLTVGNTVIKFKGQKKNEK
jgi:hypothetical protein